MITHEPNPCKDLVCKEFPELKRLNYCHGQMLGAQDFVDEQSYFLQKMALLTRCLDGYGVVCGMVVTPNPESKEASGKDSYDPSENGYELIIGCGVAVDSRGRELVNGNPETKLCLPYSDPPLAPDGWCCDTDRQKFQQKRNKSNATFDVWVTVEYRACLDGKQELPSGGCCGDQVRTIQNRWNERPRFCLTFDPPPDQSCDSCCDPIEETRLWLARLTFMGSILISVDNTIRRHISTYEPTRVKGINWLHTGVYEEHMAECLLTNGLTIEFSAPIDEQSIANHRVTLAEGGKYIETNDLVEIALSDELDINKNNPLQILQVRIEPVFSPVKDKDGNTVKDKSGNDLQECRKIRIKGETRRLAPPLRILITLRTEFILDKCCRAVDGSNIGGSISYCGWDHGDIKHPADMLERTTKEHAERYHSPDPACITRDLTYPKYSGNGVHGSEFQSWFYVVGNGCMQKHDAQQADADPTAT